MLRNALASPRLTLIISLKVNTGRKGASTAKVPIWRQHRLQQQIEVEAIKQLQI